MKDCNAQVDVESRVNRPALVTGSFVPQRSKAKSTSVNRQCNSGGCFRIIKTEKELFEAGAKAARNLLRNFARV